MTTKQQIGQQFKRLRQARGWTLAEAADRLGYAGEGAIANIETGRRLPPLERLADVAAGFGLTVRGLVGEIFSEKPLDIS